MVKKLLATLTTDNQGRATYTYTGTGAGDVKFSAESTNNGSLSSEIYGILDCLKYDKGLSSEHDDNVWVSTTYISRGEEYSTLTHTSNTLAYVEIDGDVCVEFDVMTDMTINAQLGRVADGSTSLLPFSLNNLGLTTNEWHHLKVEIINNQCTISNTENNTLVTGDVTGFDQIGIRVSANYHTYFKEVKVYTY